MKKYLTKYPVLKYYNVNEEVTIQCDASETGLRAVLMQKGQPVCYASRALTGIETRYAQIEKELLAMVWSCHKFDQYIYGRDIIHVESDHEPLQAVFKKPKYTAVTQMTTENVHGVTKLFSGHPVQERLSNVHCRCPEPCLQAYNREWPA